MKDGLATLEIWTEDPEGKRTTVGKATVEVPQDTGEA
jgi:hypothetical protein